MPLTQEEIAKFDEITGLKTTPGATPRPQGQSFADKIKAAAQPVEQPKQSFMDKATGVAQKVVDVIGAKGITDAYGAEIARQNAKTPQEKAIIEQNQYPSQKEVVGSALQTGSLFIPVGTAAKGATAAAKAIGIGEKAAKIAGNVVVGAGTGLAYDVGEKMQTGDTSGLATIAGAAIPLAGPAVKATGKIAGSALGKTTGVGQEVISKGFQAAKKGGVGKEAFKTALRGGSTPEKLVEDAKNSLGEIFKKRTEAYQKDLATIKTKNNVIDHTPIIEKFNKKLADFGVVENNGVADFTRAPGLGRYEKDLKQLSATLAQWGTREGDNTIAGIDKLKQVINDYKIGTPDAKKFDSFVSDLSSEAKNIIEENLTKSGDTEALATYKRMLGDYEEKSGLIREIQKGLSLNDKASIDTAFRKLTSALRQNNEFRQELVQELDQATGGQLLNQIAGQQMSPLMPRGLSGPVGAVGGTSALLTGVGIAKLLPAIVAFSPRAIGELVLALGFVGRNAKKVTEFLTKNIGKLQAPGDAALQGIKQDVKTIAETPGKEGGFVTVPSIKGKASPAEKATLRDYTDMLSGDYNPDEKTLFKLENDAAEIMQKYGIKTVKNPKAQIKQIAKLL